MRLKCLPRGPGTARSGVRRGDPLGSRPGIAVIIPATSSSHHLAEALDTVYGQDVRHDEVVVVDAGGSDHVRLIVRAFGRGVRCVPSPGPGSARALNAGIDATRGGLIAFLDPDDLWVPEKTARQLALLQAHPDLAMVFSDMKTTEADRVWAVTHFEEQGFRGVCTPSSIFLHDMVATPTVIVRREALRVCGGFDEGLDFGHETDLWFRIALRHRFAAITEPLVIRRLHRGNVTRDARQVASGRVRIWAKYLDEVIQREPHLRSALKADYAAKRWQHLLLEGVVAIHEGRRSEARRHLIRAIRACPDRPSAYAFLGATFMGDRALKVLRDTGMV